MDEALKEIKVVVYKKVVEGDLKKFYAQSNVKKTGGGARDLRFSPAEQFFPIFQRMFPTCESDGTYTGVFYWPEHEPTEVTIHPPTVSRGNEIRIAKVHECIPDKYIPHTVGDCILILREDDWHPKIKNEILEGLNAHRRANTSPMGFIDIEKGGSFTNGQ